MTPAIFLGVVFESPSISKYLQDSKQLCFMDPKSIWYHPQVRTLSHCNTPPALRRLHPERGPARPAVTPHCSPILWIKTSKIIGFCPWFLQTFKGTPHSIHHHLLVHHHLPIWRFPEIASKKIQTLRAYPLKWKFCVYHSLPGKIQIFGH